MTKQQQVSRDAAIAGPATDAFQFLHTPEDRAIRRRMTIETDARYLKADRADAAVMRAKRVQS